MGEEAHTAREKGEKKEAHTAWRQKTWGAGNGTNRGKTRERRRRLRAVV